jgi:hypothetical protein
VLQAASAAGAAIDPFFAQALEEQAANRATAFKLGSGPKTSPLSAKPRSLGLSGRKPMIGFISTIREADEQKDTSQVRRDSQSPVLSESWDRCPPIRPEPLPTSALLFRITYTLAIQLAIHYFSNTLYLVLCLDFRIMTVTYYYLTFDHVLRSDCYLIQIDLLNGTTTDLEYASPTMLASNPAHPAKIASLGKTPPSNIQHQQTPVSTIYNKAFDNIPTGQNLNSHGCFRIGRM